MRTALVIAYYFPPLGGGGVQRSAKFVKYLPQQGWTPVVLTVRPNRRNVVEQGLDNSLLADIPEQVEVIRARSMEFVALYDLLNRMKIRRALYEAERLVPFLHQDYKFGWYPFALSAARRRIEAAQVDVIYSTSTPYAAHFVAKALSREYGIPWVADFRDPWTQAVIYEPAAPGQSRLDRRLEAGIMASADAVIANTQANQGIACREFGVSPEKVTVIPNGFDPADFEQLGTTEPRDERFVVACIGKFYEMADPDAFFRAYRRFSDEQPDAHLRFLGPRTFRLRRAAEQLLEPGRWEASDRIEHADALRAMLGATVLLANLPFATAGYWVPGKLYEYLATNRPILFIGPLDGDAAEIVRRAHAGVTVHNDEEAILTALRTLHADWKAGRALRQDPEVVREYDRRGQARTLAAVFERVSRARHEASPANRIPVNGG